MQLRSVLAPTLAPLAMALLLAGCGSSTSASKANFAKAIDVPLAKRCISLDPTNITGPLLTGTTYPLSLPIEQAGGTLSAEQTAQSNTRTFGPFDALVKAGLLTSAEAAVKPQFGNKQVPGKIYSLTEVGKKVLARPNWLAFCAGHYKVAEVVNYTVPGKEMDGTTGSEVNFTYHPDAVSAWATNDAIKAEFPEFSKNLSTSTEQPPKGRADLVLMSDGWQASISSL